MLITFRKKIQMDIDTVNSIFASFKQIKFINITKHFLNRKNPTYTIYISLDSPDIWKNNFFFSSKYAIFQLYNNNLQITSKHFSFPNFRKLFLTTEKKLYNSIAKFIPLS